MEKHFDAIIIGAGQAGPALAARLSTAGQRVAIVERHLVGGTCVNTGCMPTKAMVASAYAAHLARRGAEYGVVTGPISIDMGRVHARTSKVSSDAQGRDEEWLRGLKNCTLIFGHARFEGGRSVRVGDDLLTAAKIFINVGGRAFIPDMPGVADVPLLTNSSILKLSTVPAHLVVIGGSYVGLEFAQAFRRFGAEVTVVEKGERLVGREDERVSAELQRIFADEGIAIRTHMNRKSAKASPIAVSHAAISS